MTVADSDLWNENLPSVKLDNNLAVAVVVDLLELADVAYEDNTSVDVSKK